MTDAASTDHAGPSPEDVITPTAVMETGLTADAVAFCPHGGRHHLLACGCYELIKDEEPARRVGRLFLLDASKGAHVLQKIDGPGVLDCAWLPKHHGTPLLATASSEGGANLYRLADESDTLQPEASGFVACEGSDVCITLDWSVSAQSPLLALSSTAGMVHVCSVQPSQIRCVRAWQAHELEGWAVAFSVSDEQTLYSGADDATLKVWDLRCDPEDGASATASNRRSHGAGVCCISPSSLRPHVLATGSYDGLARLWDARQLRSPLSELDCGGGVWRLRWHPERDGLLLAACMHVGFRVLRTGGSGVACDSDAASADELRTAAEYTAHGLGVEGQAVGLAYGADWCHSAPVGRSDASAATCSFYDRLLHTWDLSHSNASQN